MKIHTKFASFLNENYIDNDGNLEELSQDDINKILTGYIECALWTENERLSEDYDNVDINVNNIDIDSRIDAYNDIKTFIKNAGKESVQEAIDKNGLEQLGHDIWLTRNGHGSGFFDHMYDNEDALTNTAKSMKSIDLYVGDDGKLYFM